MRLFECDHCLSVVAFDADQCDSCGALLGYVPEHMAIRALRVGARPATYQTARSRNTWWRCLNAAWGCNWMVPADAEGVWCRSCRLTRGRPDEERVDAVATWMSAEAAKRRLVHQLDTLGLPVEQRSPDNPRGLVFDLVHLPGEPALTGHRDGVITLDLAEADDRHRDEMRHRLDESFRTVVGHLRHEVGHHYWHELVGQTDHLAGFRALFGDERTDYGSAIADHYSKADSGRCDERFITEYAASHPLEDWAETFAHYLHILDAIETAVARGLTTAGNDPSVPSTSVREIIAAWRAIADAINAVSESLGNPAVYPFELTDVVVDKIEFVHARVAEHTARHRFYAPTT